MENIKDEIANGASQIKSKIWRRAYGQAHYDIRILLYDKIQWPISNNIMYGIHEKVLAEIKKELADEKQYLRNIE